MKNRNYFFFIFFALVLAACGSKDTVKLVDTNFDDEISLNMNLSFTFSKDLVPDSLVGKWTDEEYIDFSPKVEGKFNWQTNKILVFIPKFGFAPSTRYQAKIKNSTFQYTDRAFVGDKEFDFHTPVLEIVSTRAYWEMPEDGAQEPYVRMEVSLNQEILPSELGDYLEIKIDDANKSYAFTTTEKNDVIGIKVLEVKREDKNIDAELKIKKGFGSSFGNMKTTSDYLDEFEIPSPFKLSINDIQPSYEGSEGMITVYTSQAVEEEGIKGFIEIDPKIRYDVEVYSSYFVLKSDKIRVDSKYDLTIKEGLKGKLGGELKSDFSKPISFGKIDPSIKFANQKEFYLSGKGSKNVSVSIINVPQIELNVIKIYENNILSFLRNNNMNSSYSDYYDDYYYYDYCSNNNEAHELGDVILHKSIQTADLPRQGVNSVLSLDFKDILKDHSGIYFIEVKSPDNYYLKAQKLIAISDIGLVVKEGREEFLVFANSIIDANPLSGVEVRILGRNNQVSQKAFTDENGLVRIPEDEHDAPGFSPNLITAQYGTDFNFLPLNKTKVNISRFDVGGKRQNETGYSAFIYGDRNLYRPGETVNISGIVRDAEWQSPGTIPVNLKITSPNGRTFKNLKKVLDDQGAFETSFEVPASASTGVYSVNIYTSNHTLIGSSIIKLEEFMPDRIRVDVSLNGKEFEPGDQIEANIQADNLFGTPAANRNYEIEVSTKRMGFYSRVHGSYNYHIEGAETYFSSEYRDGQTEEDGSIYESFDVPSSYKDMGKLRSDLFTTVFDETGRPVNRLNSVFVYTQDVFYGVKAERYYSKTGQPASFKLIAVDKEGEALDRQEAKVTLIKHEYKTVLSKSGSSFRYRSEKVERILKSKTMELREAETVYSFTPEESGRYELRISRPGADSYVSQEIYAYGWGSTSYSSFEVNNEGQIDIEFDKDRYQIGDKAKAILKAPFSGKILVTLESDRVIDHFYVETDKRVASIEIDIKEEFVPNIYLSATLFRAHEATDIPLTVAYGVAPILVDNPASMIPISIEAVSKSRSKTKQKIKVKAKPNSNVTIAAVDEGILQVAGYQTPDPFAFFYQKKALEIGTYNVYPYLFPEMGAIRSVAGGGGSEMAKRLNPMKNNRVKLVSFWSGIIETDNKGEAEYEIDIPQFSGSLRIMAIGYEGKSFGSEEKYMQVADPIVLSVALPRFLSPGDTVNVPVIISNTTDQPTKAKTKIELEGPLQVVGSSSITEHIASNGEAEVTFKVYAKKEIGQASVHIETDAMKEIFSHKTEIAVRPESPLQKRTDNGSVKAGEKKRIDVHMDDFIESSVNCKLVISKNPLVQFTESFDYLVRYPYGCVEQTTSAAFPQLYFGDMLGTVYTNNRAKADAISNVQAAIDRLKLMQLYHGGLSYWPGGGYDSWWGSVYAAHFIVEAEKAGFEVDESFKKELLRYLKNKLKDKKTFTYYYNYNKQKEIAPKEVPYSLYVLTLADEKPTALLNYYRARTEILSLDGKYLLAGAFALAGDEKKAKEVMPKAFEGEKAVQSFGGSFYSYIRDYAISLNVLLETDPDNQQIGHMVNELSGILASKSYLNTQERSFGFLALGKFARMAEQSEIDGEVLANGKSIGKIEENNLVFTADQILGKKLELQVEGEGKAYYFWESEGISKDGTYVEEDNHIKIRRKFYNRYGRLITNNQFKQNDLVLVELELSNGTQKYIENIAISDILPAAFEIENPRLTVLPPGLNFPNNRSQPDYMDIRDDRINLFVNLRGNRKMYFYYLVRVVSTGEFKMGPVGADAMYNAEYHSYHGGGSIRVKR